MSKFNTLNLVAQALHRDDRGLIARIRRCSDFRHKNVPMELREAAIKDADVRGDVNLEDVFVDLASLVALSQDVSNVKGDLGYTVKIINFSEPRVEKILERLTDSRGIHDVMHNLRDIVRLSIKCGVKISWEELFNDIVRICAGIKYEDFDTIRSVQSKWCRSFLNDKKKEKEIKK